VSWADDAALNRALWTKINSEYTDEQAAAKWAETEVTWGIWAVPDAELGVMGDLRGLDIVELGCGTAYMSAVFARQGARPVGVDITPAQLETARRMMARTGIEFPLVEADAGETGLPSESFDIAFSEYGASIWVDPDRWVPEAARLLRPGGRLIFLCGSTLSHLCTDEDGTIHDRLVNPQFGMHRIETPDGIEFHLPHGERIRNLQANGFQLDELVEIQAPAGAERHPYYSYVTPEWGRKWPLEEIWAARKRV
jgi:ubiquinone/menaquinone biosynthesis C-methylase UbiE